jgi:hypothetical protein
MHLHIVESYKSALHMAMFFIAMFKAHAISRKLNLLEKRITDK